VLIAGIIDTDGSNSVSIGDTVTFGTYPHLDGTQAGTFLGADTTITSVLQNDGNTVEVGVADGTIRWVDFGSAERLQTLDSSNNIESHFFDGIAIGTLADLARAEPTVNGPGDPDSAILENIARTGDDGFLDVLIA
jgi:hypothetical protein